MQAFQISASDLGKHPRCEWKLRSRRFWISFSWTTVVFDDSLHLCLSVVNEREQVFVCLFIFYSVDISKLRPWALPWCVWHMNKTGMSVWHKCLLRHEQTIFCCSLVKSEPTGQCAPRRSNSKLKKYFCYVTNDKTTIRSLHIEVFAFFSMFSGQQKLRLG